MARKRAVLGWAVGALLATLLLLVAVFLFVDRTRRGQSLVLDEVIDLLEGAINAEITYEGVRSSELTRGATLFGVRVTGLDGRPFLVVDSLRTTYAWRTFLSGDVVLESLVLWGADLTISRYPGEEEFNADRIFQTDADVPSPEEPTRRILLRDVRLVDAFVEVLQPVDPEDPPPERMLRVTRPGVQGELQRFAFESVQAWMPEVQVASPEKLGPEVTLDSLSLVGHVYEDPFFVTQLEGQVAWGDGALTILADELALPGTRARGRVVADMDPDDAAWLVEMQLEASHYALDDLRWLLPDLPEGEGEGDFAIRLTDRGDLRFGFDDATLEMEETRLAGSGTVLRDGETTFEDVRVQASPLALARLEPFLTEPLPLEGTLQGRIALDGTLARLGAEGVVTLREPGHDPTTADFRGTFHLEEGGFGVTGLDAELDPLDYGLLAIFFPASRLEGGGRASVSATGSLAGGLRFDAHLEHAPDGLPASQILAEGSVRERGGDYTLDLQADVSPLSLTALASYWPDLPVTGEVSGTLRALGPLADLSVTTDLQTEAGALALVARFDARDPGAFYRVEGELGGFVVSQLVPELPEPTVFTGFVQLEGRGLEPETAVVDAALSARASRVGELDVDSARVELRIREGALHLDTLVALVGGIDLDARGTLALREGGPAGEIRVGFSSDSLGGLRPLLMGRDLIARDTVDSGLLRAQLEAEGIDPDTLPSLEEVTVSGRVRGEVTLAGSLERFSATGTSAFEQIQYGTSTVRGAQVTFSAEGLPGLEGDIHATLVADSLRLAGRAFAGAELVLDYSRPVGAVSLVLERHLAEDYRARARFQLDSLGGRLELDELALRFDSLVWQLERPTVVTWDDLAFGVSDLALSQSGAGGVRITATGALPRGAEQADFTLDVVGLGLEEVGRLLQLEQLGVEGTVDLSVHVQGTADDPSLQGTILASDLRYRQYQLDSVGGGVTYDDRRLALELHAQEGDLEVLHVTGTIPADLALRGVDVRFPDEEIDLEVVADSLPAAFVTSVLSDLANVEGTVAGQFEIGGTLQNPSPSGQLVLQGAAATVTPIGVRHENVVGTLDLLPDGTLQVDASATAGGTARVTGTVKLEPLSNPTLDLEISLSEFLAVDRRDVLANVSGTVTLTGTYERPFIQGLLSQGRGLRVEEGILFVEEFVRAASVVDLTDPRFRSQIDPALLEDDPVVAETPNPFMQNLRVDVDLAMEQASLRSDEMDVELGGALKITYSRGEQEIVMLGDLLAIRGEYSVLGRRFQVREGTVEFLGIPGVNPNLDISAEARVRRPTDQDLIVSAQVTGTLESPRVALSSEETGVASSDLVSYLLFGRPTYELGSSQQQVVGNVTLAGVDVAGSMLLGGVTGRLSAFARGLGLDYFAITQVGNLTQGAQSIFSQALVEIGQYLNDDVFVGLAVQPLGSASGTGGTFLNRLGLRLEWTPTELYTLQAFWEDRFLRSQPQGFEETFGSTQKILGLFVFSEWGY